MNYNPRTRKLYNYGIADGYNGNQMYSLEIDDEQNVWITSNKGISKFIKDQKRFVNYSSDDGLPDCNFLSHSCKDNLGNLYFSSNNGILIINPANFISNPIIPKLVFTGFMLDNKTVKVKLDAVEESDEFQLEKQIGELNKIELKYNQNIITIEYAALSYTNPQKNQYAYYLEGAEQEWNYVGTRRFAHYSGLQPGSYVFHVKGSNNSGIWNEKGITLTIIISPPFWQTWWFRLLMLATLVLIILLFFRMRLAAIRAQKIELEKQVKERTHEIEMQNEEIRTQKDDITEKAEELKLLNATKDKFFSIIAHDLKNPFSVIMGFSDLMISEFDKSSKQDKLKFLEAIKKSSSKAFSLLENLLQWARSQTSAMQVSPTTFDLNVLVWDTFQLLRVNADNKKISLVNEVPQGIMITTDRNMLHTVVRNLVSNSIKFSEHNTAITISSLVKPENILITIKDQGVGMEPQIVEKLFRIDQHVSSSGTAGEAGTGLGLIICSEFIAKNNGSIKVESKKGEGSSFFICLPMDLSASVAPKPAEPIQVPLAEIAPTIEKEHLIGETGLCILLIDDNDEIRNTISVHLKGNFKVLEAVNGREGVSIATEEIPDLIVCDWMMPEMDGITFCRMIKQDERTSHIPVIMLTAKNADEDERQGLVTGADDYMTKPFNAQNLVIKIRNILESKKKLREKFARDMGVKVKFDSGNETDNLFVEKVTAIIEKNLTDPDFGHEQLAKEMGMGKTNLYKKMNALTGLSVHLYIRNIRLHKAAEMFRLGSKNVSQVAYETGFNDHTYFTRCFTELFKKNPTEFISSLK